MLCKILNNKDKKYIDGKDMVEVSAMHACCRKDESVQEETAY